MSDAHIRNVPSRGAISLPREATISASGPMVFVSSSPVHSTQTTLLLTEAREECGSPGIVEDGSNQCQLSQDKPDTLQDNTATLLEVMETSTSLPTTVAVTNGQQHNTSVQLIGNGEQAEQSIIVTYGAPATEKSSPTVVSSEGDGQKSCLICGDKGSGFHYSAFSCEGCKGFFKRTVQKSLSYNCKSDGDCVINKFTRNSCQHCRFQRCLEVGMKREAVREDRSPGGKHRHKRQKLDNTQVAPSDWAGRAASQPKTTDKPRFRDNLLESLVQAKPFLVPKVEGSVSLDSLSINELMQYGYMELRYIIEWAKKVPGFKGLGVDDQMALLKSAFMELNVLRLSYRSVGLKGFIKFAEGLIVPIDYATSIGWGKELITATADFATRLEDIYMDETEFCTLNAIVLTYPDATGIQNKHQVTGLQTQMLDSLRRYVNYTYPEDHRRYGKMLLRLPALRTVSAKAAERFLSLTLDGNIQLSALVSEMML